MILFYGSQPKEHVSLFAAFVGFLYFLFIPLSWLLVYKYSLPTQPPSIRIVIASVHAMASFIYFLIFLWFGRVGVDTFLDGWKREFIERKQDPPVIYWTLIYLGVWIVALVLSEFLLAPAQFLMGFWHQPFPANLPALLIGIPLENLFLLSQLMARFMPFVILGSFFLGLFKRLTERKL